jgi:hypothetical protein
LKDISFKYYKCDDLIQKFGEEKLGDRFSKLFSEMIEFLNMNNLRGKATVNKVLLANVVIDYFSDIMRLKDFHTDIDRVNSQKVISYTAYWLLYRKPIQIADDISDNKELATLNERFVLQYILNYLSERERRSHILLRQNKGLENFAGLMLYYLVYRRYDAQAIEMIITAFLAGQIYERTDEDITEQLHPFDF